MTRVPLDLAPEEARALAQFVKRTGFGDCKRLATRFDGGLQADLMWAAVRKLQQALAEVGHAPR
jgi:hypothetical protein